MDLMQVSGEMRLPMLIVYESKKLKLYKQTNSGYLSFFLFII